MNERWNYTVIADEPGGTALEMRVTLEDRDSDKQATMQITVGGVQVEVNDAARDYEAPEWRAKEVLGEGGVDDPGAYLEALKSHLRDAVVG